MIRGKGGDCLYSSESRDLTISRSKRRIQNVILNMKQRTERDLWTISEVVTNDNDNNSNGDNDGLILATSLPAPLLIQIENNLGTQILQLFQFCRNKVL